MDISTSTNLCAFTRDRTRIPVERCIPILANAGYRVLDMNFCIAMNPDSPMRGDRWQSYVEKIGELAADCHVVFKQSHLPYYDVDRAKGTEKAELMEELIRRSIVGSSMLGVRWAVTHPYTVYAEAEDHEACQAANVAYFDRHVELASRHGVGIALESDFDLPDQRIYCGRLQELIDLCDAFRAPDFVGLCYDFGHANLQHDGFSHSEKLCMAGSRLKALHVQDNHGQSDEHLLPYFGSIDWDDCMLGLARCGYQGDLTFEVQEFGRCLPEDMKHLTA